jgi:hypothetical protein
MRIQNGCHAAEIVCSTTWIALSKCQAFVTVITLATAMSFHRPQLTTIHIDNVLIIDNHSNRMLEVALHLPH